MLSRNPTAITQHDCYHVTLLLSRNPIAITMIKRKSKAVGQNDVREQTTVQTQTTTDNSKLLTTTKTDRQSDI